jgi:GH24 family phage-related lysozyme (muramidase)
VPYNIGDGTLTIGYGTTQKYEPEAYRQLAPRCTEPQASAVMEKNIRQNYASTVLFYVNKSGRDLSDFKQHHFDALVSFQYNEGSIQDETFWRMFKNGASYEAVANQLEKTKISYGGGVVTRRKAEAKLFSTGYYPPVNIYDYGAGKPIVTSGSSMTGVSNSNLSKFYNAINEVSADHKTLKRKSFKEALDNVELDDEQKEIAEFLYEMDSFSAIFGEEFDFSFNLNGTYLSGGILGDYAGLSIPRQEILSIAQQICDLNLMYLWGGKEYDMNKPINEINRLDCSGYTSYIMGKVFGATYMINQNTWGQRDNYCYRVDESEIQPGDLVFNVSCTHTLIYAGEKDGKRYYFHSPQTGKPVQCSTYNSPVEFYRLKNVDYDAIYERRW